MTALSPSCVNFMMTKLDKMAALSGTCVRQWLRFLGTNAARTRRVDHNSNCRTNLPASNHHLKQLVRPLSVTSVVKNEEKQPNQPTESAMPLVAMLREAEEKAKRETDEDRKKKEERKKRTARIQKWAMRITGGMLVGASLLTVYELGRPECSVLHQFTSVPIPRP